MPKIEVIEKRFYSLIGKNFSHTELEDLLPAAKGELDEVLADSGVLKLELNDTNRPDLWSTAGLARLLRIYTGGKKPQYDFFSRKGGMKDAGKRTILVDPALKDIRPYIAAFAVKGAPMDEATLDDIIQSQEKVCWNYGRKRRSIAMGVYRSNLMVYPVHYDAVDPGKTSFKPLGGDRVMNLLEINKEHPKGVEYGGIVAGFPKFPFLRDDKGGVLSFPPVINSDAIGAVEAGDTELFIELTGTELDSLLHATSIMACDFADFGFEILPVKVIYPYDTPYGRELVTPFYFQTPQTVKIPAVSKLLGEEFSPAAITSALTRMGAESSISGDTVTLFPPEYRNDFLHGVDITEDIMIGRGMNSFSPVIPKDFTVGRLTDAELFGRKATTVMVGLGFQEMIFNYLGSGKDYIEKMRIKGDDTIRISNPMSENFEYVRSSIIPCLLQAESVSGNAVYPHHVFEIGKIARLDRQDNYGTVTLNHLGFLSAAADAGFNLVDSQISAILYYLCVEFSLEELDDPRFIPGRGARVVVDGKPAGFFGEIAPEVLENWNIEMPCTAGELCLDLLR